MISLHLSDHTVEFFFQWYSLLHFFQRNVNLLLARECVHGILFPGVSLYLVAQACMACNMLVWTGKCNHFVSVGTHLSFSAERTNLRSLYYFYLTTHFCPICLPIPHIILYCTERDCVSSFVCLILQWWNSVACSGITLAQELLSSCKDAGGEKNLLNVLSCRDGNQIFVKWDFFQCRAKSFNQATVFYY